LHAGDVQSSLVVESDGRDESSIAPPFGEVITVRGADGFDVAENETPFARVAQRCGDWLRESPGERRPALLWIKSRGVPTPWIPPQAFAELYLEEFGLVEDAAPAGDDEEESEPPPDAVPEATAGDESDGSLDWRYAAAMYAAYVTLIDRWLGMLVTTLDESPHWKDALLIVTAAAGLEMGEHGSLGDQSHLLRSESAQTPLWVRLPGSDQGGTRRQTLVQTLDLPPTLLEWFCGGDAVEAASIVTAPPLSGCSLIPLIRNQQVAPRPFLLMGNDRTEWGIRTPDFFYVEPGDRHPEPKPPARLFEKPHDRWDQSDVLSQYPQVADELQGLLCRRIDELTARSTGFSRSPP
jgi:arylsulfatase A-like enzyme